MEVPSLWLHMQSAVKPIVKEGNILWVLSGLVVVTNQVVMLLAFT
jgi:hypothetical protein